MYFWILASVSKVRFARLRAKLLEAIPDSSDHNCQSRISGFLRVYVSPMPEDVYVQPSEYSLYPVRALRV